MLKNIVIFFFFKYFLQTRQATALNCQNFQLSNFFNKTNSRKRSMFEVLGPSGHQFIYHPSIYPSIRSSYHSSIYNIHPSSQFLQPSITQPPFINLASHPLVYQSIYISSIHLSIIHLISLYISIYLSLFFCTLLSLSL